MPFGLKKDPTGLPDIDFDRVYRDAIRPAIEAAGLIPLRGDEESAGGIIHKEMFERLLLCEFAVADLTTANANVFYELGVRHTARPSTTQAIFAKHQPIPFDVSFVHAFAYSLGAANTFGVEEASALREGLAEKLVSLRRSAGSGKLVDSPIFQLVGGWKTPNLTHTDTDLFRERVRADQDYQRRMEEAKFARPREVGLKALQALEAEIRAQHTQSTGVIIDLLLAYRALEAWREMVNLIDFMSQEIARQVPIQEQLALALNRLSATDGNPALRTKALGILEHLNETQGPSSERGGLIGRIYKDLWSESIETEPRAARGYLKRAIECYVQGFESDWRDPYPGVNAVALLEVLGDDASLKEFDRLFAVVRFSASQAGRGRKRTYWDHATQLELAVLASDRDEAERALDLTLAAASESWALTSTAKNIDLIVRARAARGIDVGWIEAMIVDLNRAAAR